jgi:hypothetical protein
MADTRVGITKSASTAIGMIDCLSCSTNEAMSFTLRVESEMNREERRHREAAEREGRRLG